MFLKDAPFDTLLVMREGMGEEVRETYYVRRRGDARLPNFVATFRLACLQGCLWR
jgi:hypothetical protein